MTRLATTAALLALLSPAAAYAGSITLDAPIKGASLEAGDVDMAVYFTETENDAYEVVATYASKAASDRPQRLVMALQDGDAARFGLPGHRGTLYTFARTGSEVSITADVVPQKFASAE